VDTPVRLRAPAPERHIDAEPSGDLFLRTSPELHMKRLLAAGYERLFQMGPCFRRGEYGTLHHAEYTMLEWYRAQADYHDILDDTQSLIRHAAETVLGSQTIQWQDHTVRLDGDWTIMAVRDAFAQWAGWDPVTSYDADRFDLDLVEKVEPEIRTCPTPFILTDYPLEAASLARTKPGDPAVAERWELYIAGIEIANAYSELTDAQEQRERFDASARQRREAGLTVYPSDLEFLRALERGLPPSGGIALGVDRLVMLLADAPTISDVTAFEE
jgi:elongation factor P--(R)-beta-lysine ligase